MRRRERFQLAPRQTPARPRRLDLWGRRRLCWLLSLQGLASTEIVEEIVSHTTDLAGQPWRWMTVEVDITPLRMQVWLPKLRRMAGFRRSAEGLVSLHEHLRDRALREVERVREPAERARLLRSAAELNAQVLAMAQSAGLLERAPERHAHEHLVLLDRLARSYEEVRAGAGELAPADEAPPALPPPRLPEGNGRPQAAPVRSEPEAEGDREDET